MCKGSMSGNFGQAWHGLPSLLVCHAAYALCYDVICLVDWTRLLLGLEAAMAGDHWTMKVTIKSNAEPLHCWL